MIQEQNTPSGLPSLLRPGQAAAVLGIPESTLQAWLNREVLPSIQPSGR